MKIFFQEVKATLDELLAVNPIDFTISKTTLNKKGIAVVDKVAAVLKQYPGTGVTIHGHDIGVTIGGQSMATTTFSLARANSVAEALVKAGCKNPIVTRGWGMEHPTIGKAKLDRVVP